MRKGVSCGWTRAEPRRPHAASFFFSSRRRHTRLQGDWSSDVCSSDLLSMLSQLGVIFFLFLIGLELDPKLIQNRGHAAVVISHVSIIAPFLLGAALTVFRSEERRVGKECRSRWSPYH